MIKYKDLKIGDFFVDNGITYVKIYEVDEKDWTTDNCFNLTYGETDAFEGDCLVEQAFENKTVITL